MSYTIPDHTTDAGEGPSPAPINPLDTGHTAFLGCLPAGLRRADALLRTPVLIHSLAEFERAFLAPAGQRSNMDAPDCHLPRAVAGYFANGGRVLWVVLLDEAVTSLDTATLGLLDNIEPVSQIAAPGYCDGDSHAALIAHCESHLARLAILDTPLDVSDWRDLARGVDAGGLRPTHVALGRAALYAPWLQMEDPLTGAPVWVPPSGHVCGAMARNDRERGVHKAPANLPLHEVQALRQAYTDVEQHELNPAGVNLIRTIRGEIRIWGARSLAPADSEWQLLPVRRLADMILYSVRVGLGWTATETHDETMRAQIRGQVGQFLNGLFRKGCFAGQTPERAWFVRCDESLNGSEEVQARRVRLMIGIAPLRPEAFNVLQLSLPTRGALPAGASRDTASATARTVHHGSADGFHTTFVAAEDRAAWSPLFRGYAEFYGVELQPGVEDRVWSWLLDPEHVLEGLLVRDRAGEAVGMAHVRTTPRTLGGHEIGFLDDLFVWPGARGEGAADALFAALRELARQRDWQALRWITRHDNSRARAFYDRYTGGPSDFILYHWDQPAS